MNKDETKEFINKLAKEHSVSPPKVTYAITGPSHGNFIDPDHIEISRIDKVCAEELGGDYDIHLKGTAAHEFCHYRQYQTDPKRYTRLYEEEKKAKDYWEAYYGSSLEKECYEFEEKHTPFLRETFEEGFQDKRGEILGCVCLNRGYQGLSGLSDCMEFVLENPGAISDSEIRSCVAA